jgi:serine/threonine protein kinase
VSPEAKDLVMKMVAKDPKNRVTASQALEHSWFKMDHNETCILSNAQENMKKYHNKLNENRFNVGKIKPEFSMVTCTPLLNSRYSGRDSPLVFSGDGSKNSSAVQSPVLNE